MFSEVYEAAAVIAPHMNKICVVPVTTSSVRFDLTDAAQMGAMAGSVGPATPEYALGILTLVADGGKVYFFFNNADAGTVDETATSGANRCMMIPDGGRMDFKLKSGFTWILVKGSAAGFLRIYRSSAMGEGTTPK